jgi:transcriptional regulator with XRE-family HTH domain
MVGAALRNCRKEKKLSQEQLARAVGVACSYVSRIECGRSTPSLYSLLRATSALGLDLADFFIEFPMP